MIYFKKSLILLVLTFVSAKAWTAEHLASTEDAPSVVKTQLFKKLREDSDNFDFQDFKNMHEIMKPSISLHTQKDEPKQKGTKKGDTEQKDPKKATFYQGSHLQDGYFHTLIYIKSLDEILKDKHLDYYLKLKTSKIVGLQTQLEYELTIEHSRRVCNVKIQYVSKTVKEFLQKSESLKKVQHSLSQKAQKDFLDRKPIRQKRALRESNLEFSRAKEAAQEASQLIQDHYSDLKIIPMTSRVVGDKQRAFAKLRANTQAHMPKFNSTRQRGDSLSSHVEEKEEKKTKDLESGTEKKDISIDHNRKNHGHRSRKHRKESDPKDLTSPLLKVSDDEKTTEGLPPTTEKSETRD